MASSTKRFSGMPDRAYPEVFNTIPPNQPKERKPGQFTQQQLKQYFEEGYVQVDEFFTREELDQVREAIAKLLDNLAEKLFKAGKITKLHKDAGLFQRLTLLEQEFPGTNILMHKLGILPQAFRNLWTNDKALNVMEQLLGTQDIQGSPIWNMRTKTPRNTATIVPWHQDSAYFDKDSYGVMVVTAWIPLLDSNEHNGCLQMVKKGHKKGLVATHTGCWKNTWHIEVSEEEMERTLGVDVARDSVICAVPYGGALFFNNVIPHRSLPNISNDTRWSLDLRWQRMDQPAGCFGLKDGIQFRSSTDPNLEIDWEAFEAKDRNKLQNKLLGETDDDLVPIIAGPWMKQWEITHHNQHTASLDAACEAEQTGRKA